MRLSPEKTVNYGRESTQIIIYSTLEQGQVEAWTVDSGAAAAVKTNSRWSDAARSNLFPLDRYVN